MKYKGSEAFSPPAQPSIIVISAEFFNTSLEDLVKYKAAKVSEIDPVRYRTNFSV